MSEGLTHFDEDGRSRMVDVGEKPVTRRSATASGRVMMRPETGALIRDKQIAKGDVLEVARLGGIMSAKQTSNLIPLCHPIGLDSVKVDFDFVGETEIRIEATVTSTGRTGVEMEALTVVASAGLVIYDMCKSVDREMTISDIRLEKKSGGKSGDFSRE